MHIRLESLQKKIIKNLENLIYLKIISKKIKFNFENLLYEFNNHDKLKTFLIGNKKTKIFDMRYFKAIELHRTILPKNHFEALKLFQEIKNYYWIGYYHEFGFGGLDVDIEKAKEYHRLV